MAALREVLVQATAGRVVEDAELLITTAHIRGALEEIRVQPERV